MSKVESVKAIEVHEPDELNGEPDLFQTTCALVALVAAIVGACCSVFLVSRGLLLDQSLVAILARVHALSLFLFAAAAWLGVLFRTYLLTFVICLVAVLVGLFILGVNEDVAVGAGGSGEYVKLPADDPCFRMNAGYCGPNPALDSPVSPPLFEPEYRFDYEVPMTPSSVPTEVVPA